MGARWTANDVLALAPDSASQRAAAGLARPACWSDAGTAGDLVWGLCAGSGGQPYQTVVDLTGPAYRCSCPSRKFPCRHALALLLARAHEQVGALPAALAAVVRSRVGYPTGREDVLATPPVADRWQVLAVRDVLDGTIPARRVWLRGEQTGRFALLLSFAPVGNFGPSIEAALIPGLQLDTDLHFYPGQPELRAVIGIRRGSPAAAGRPAGPGDVTGLLSTWSAALEQDPWLTRSPTCWPRPSTAVTWPPGRITMSWPPGNPPAGLDTERTGAQLWGSPPRSPGAGPMLEVDTSGPVNVREVAAGLSRLFDQVAGT